MKMELMNRARERAPVSAREQGLSLLVAMTAAEIFAEARPEAAHGFHVAIGRRIAGLVDLGDVQDLDGLAGRANALWAICGWGEARLVASDTGIKVVHRGVPALLEGEHAADWNTLFPAVLEGAYDAWFRQLGSGPALSTRILRHESDLVELHHGG